jgi:DNA-binding response OmpR family regulator
MKLLIIEDEKALAESIFTYIREEGYLCDIAFNYGKALEFINLGEYDCTLVDIMLPDGSGLDLIEFIKQKQPNCGIIVVSAKNSLDDKLTGLNLGADDYLTKPFHLAELNARIKSVIRRRNFQGSNKIDINGLHIDLDTREVSVNGNPINLTRREYDILIFFISNRERVITKEAIIEYIWGDNSTAFDNFDFVYTHIKNLRKKLNDFGMPDYIQSVYGVGYKFTEK